MRRYLDYFLFGRKDEDKEPGLKVDDTRIKIVTFADGHQYFEAQSYQSVGSMKRPHYDWFKLYPATDCGMTEPPTQEVGTYAYAKALIDAYLISIKERTVIETTYVKYP